MLTEEDFQVREATLHENSLIAKHFYQMWQDNDVSTYSIRSDWLKITLQFISHARQELYYKAFVAEVNGIVVGSAGCQLFTGLYPNVLEDHYRNIWLHLGCLR